MPKPKTLSALKSLEKEIAKDRLDFYYKEIKQPVRNFERELIEKNQIFLDKYDEKLEAVKDAIHEKEKELEQSEKLEKSPLVLTMTRRFASGVDFGYKGITDDTKSNTNPNINI